MLSYSRAGAVAHSDIVVPCSRYSLEHCREGRTPCGQEWAKGVNGNVIRVSLSSAMLLRTKLQNSTHVHLGRRLPLEHQRATFGVHWVSRHRMQNRMESVFL